MTDLDVTVTTWGLRHALAAVLPHVSQNDEDFMLQRVRLYVTEHGVIACATDRFTAAAAQIDATDQAPETGVFDLTTTDAKELLALFRPGKDDTDASLQMEVREKDIRFTDVSGMFPGKQLRIIPPTVDEMFPDVPQTVAGLLRRTAGVDEWPLPVSGELMGRFGAAGKAYGEPLVLQPTGAALVVSCGASFVGALMPQRLDDDGRADLVEAWDDWAAYQVACSAVHPAVKP